MFHHVHQLVSNFVFLAFGAEQGTVGVFSFLKKKGEKNERSENQKIKVTGQRTKMISWKMLKTLEMRVNLYWFITKRTPNDKPTAGGGKHPQNCYVHTFLFYTSMHVKL